MTLRSSLILSPHTPKYRSVILLFVPPLFTLNKRFFLHRVSRPRVTSIFNGSVNLPLRGHRFGLSIHPLTPSLTLIMICNPQFNYSQYYLSQNLSTSHYHAAMGNDLEANMQQAPSPQSQMNSDPSLQLYYSGYDSFQNGQHQHQNQQLPSLMIPQQPPMNIVAHSPHSSSSQASDYAGTPTLEGETASFALACL